LSAVKYYQREGLLHEGIRSAPNQVEYGESHIQRVRLIRALLETGGLSIAATKDVIAALDEQDVPLAEVFRVAQHAMSTPRTAPSIPTAMARQRVLDLAHANGWRISADNPGVDAAARAVDGLLAIGFDAPDAYLTAYATAAHTAAAADLHALRQLDDPDRVTELMVVGTVLGDPLFAALRRLAQQDATGNRYPTQTRREDT
jgi:DNA-binding transcriptional MerR regulator